MSRIQLSDCFKLNLFFWKMFGIWPGKIYSKYYRYFSIIYLFTTLVIYNIILTLNLCYTPSKIDLIIREVLFYFDEIAITTKILTVLLFRRTILDILDILHCDNFNEDNENCRQIINDSVRKYKTCWIMYALLCNFSYFVEVIIPLISHTVWSTPLHLPISNYHFLSDEVRSRYFFFWYSYQAIGIYGHMMCNLNVDSFIAGLMFCIIIRVRILKDNLKNLKCNLTTVRKHTGCEETIQYLKFKQYLKHYDIILRLCCKVQIVISLPAFIQFGISAAIICVSLCGLLTPSASDIHLFLVIYITAMTLRIFVPSWLGAQLTQKCQELVFAAYSSDWITGPGNFTQNMRIFMVRANNPITLFGMKMYPVSLKTFTSIMKTAYSLFTLVRHIQHRQDESILP